MEESKKVLQCFAVVEKNMQSSNVQTLSLQTAINLMDVLFPKNPANPNARPGLNFDAVHMPDGEDYVLRPLMEGLCRYESLIDGTLTLIDIARMNDALDVRDANAHRAREASQNG